MKNLFFLFFLVTIAFSAAAAVTDSIPAKEKKDTLFYNKTFGYDNDAFLFDLSIKKYGDKTAMEICSAEEAEGVAPTCFKRILIGELTREKFNAVLRELLKKQPALAGTVDETKVSPKTDDLFVDFNKDAARQQPKDQTKSEKQMADMKVQIEELFKEANNKRTIGYFTLMNADAKVKNGNAGKIAAVEIVLSNGSIRKNGIKVTLEDGRVFRNKKSPITLYRFDLRKADKLGVDDTKARDSGYLSLGDVINYVYNGKFSYPDEQIMHLSPDKLTDSLSVGSSISELLDVSVYSDLLALIGRKPNGVIQTQVTGTFITNTSNWRNKDIVLHNFIKAYFRLSKYDSKFTQVDSSNVKFTPSDTVVNRLYLNQIAYLQAGLKVNLMRIGIGNNQQVFINGGIEMSLTNADSLFKKDILTINYYPEIEYTISRLDNFGLETSLKWIRQAAPKNSPFTNKETIWIFNPQATVYYYPFSNPDSKIYLRYAHYAQRSDARYNYPQFQFGFKTNLFAKKDK